MICVNFILFTNIDFRLSFKIKFQKGLKYFHEIGYLHLDIKPQNFLVAENGTIKLGDFNLSRKKYQNNDDYFE